MTNELVSQRSLSLRLTSSGDYSLVPEGYEGQKYRISRVKLSPVYVTEKTRDQILMAMNEGKMYVQLDMITLMVNSIASIDPFPLKLLRQDEA